VCVLAWLAGCGLVFDLAPPREGASTPDAGGRDTGAMDALGGTDAVAPRDAEGEPEAAQSDGGLAEAGLTEAGLAEAGLAEAGVADAPDADAEEPDADPLAGDTGLDSGTGIDDAGIDASSPDAHVAPPGRVELLFPWNGFTTGSARVPELAVLPDHPLRPKLMWRPVAGASEYEVQLEDDCPLDFRTCSFPSPEVAERTPETTFHPSASLDVSSAAPVGRRYHWRVRACRADACSDWSEVRYLDVGRQTDDFDGDGWADLVAGAPGLVGVEGSAVVRYGSPVGLRRAGVDLDNPTGDAGGNFGGSVAAAGDLNGDGYADLVVGAPTQQDGEGKAFVYLGSRTGIGSSPDVTLDNPARQEGSFGFAVAGAGDLNGDGLADLVIGAIRQDTLRTDEGAAFVYFGVPTSGVGATPDLSLENPANQEGGGFGFSVEGAGDLNGDGLADLVVGAALQDAPEADDGSAFVYLGSAAGMGASPSFTLNNPADGAGGLFGASLTGGGDLNGDGYADLVVGAPAQSNGAAGEGNAFVYHGSAAGPSLFATLDSPMNQALGFFGAALDMGDFGADGFADLVVGAPFLDAPEVDEGNVFVYLGSRSGLPTSHDAALDSPGQPGSRFGFAVGAGDIDGDGFIDVVVGAPSFSSLERQEGGVFLHLGWSGGVRPDPGGTLDSPRDRVEGFFGYSVASADRARGRLDRPQHAARAADAGMPTVAWCGARRDRITRTRRGSSRRWP
jgi:hypothetical protein